MYFWFFLGSNFSCEGGISASSAERKQKVDTKPMFPCIGSRKKKKRTWPGVHSLSWHTLSTHEPSLLGRTPGSPRRKRNLNTLCSPLSHSVCGAELNVPLLYKVLWPILELWLAECPICNTLTENDEVPPSGQPFSQGDTQSAHLQPLCPFPLWVCADFASRSGCAKHLEPSLSLISV